MLTVTLWPSVARESDGLFYTKTESAVANTGPLTGDLPCKLGKKSEVMNCAPSVGTINLVMDNTLWTSGQERCLTPGGMFFFL